MAKKNGQNGSNGNGRKNGKAKPPDNQGKAGYGKPPVEHQFKPGQSGNPGGRPSAQRSIQAAMRKLVSEDYNGKDLAVALAKIAVSKALAGDHKFWEMIIERIDGKVAQELNAEIRTVSKAYPADVLEDVLNAGRTSRTATDK